MSRTVCSWCKAPLVLKDDVLVCSNTDCPACDEKYLHEELIRTRKALEGIKKVVDGFGWGYGNTHLPDYHDGLIIAEIVNEALEQKEVK